MASYVTVNVSSPNTPGLRDLQRATALDDLLARVIEARDRVRRAPDRRPLLLKIAPDLTLADLDDIVGVARARAIDGMIVGNTTISRPPTLRERATAKEAGGLSGRPLFPLSTRMLAETYVRVEGAFPLIGVGGIDSGAAAIAKIRAGADLVQLYSGLVFRGLGAGRRDQAALLAALERGRAGAAGRSGRRRCRRDHRGAWPARSIRGRLAETTSARSAPARRVHQPHDQPDRDHDHRAEQEIAPQPAHRVEAHVPDRADQALDARDDVERVEAERRQHDADQDRQQDQRASTASGVPPRKRLTSLAMQAESPDAHSSFGIVLSSVIAD